MKILMASTPALGHLNPLLAIARMAQARGDEVVLTTATCLAPRVIEAGVRFEPLAPEADLDLRRIEEFAPERARLPPGPEQLTFDFQRIFLDPMPAQAATLRSLIAGESPDLVVVDQTFCGSTPLYLDHARPRPPLATLGVTFLPLARADGAPMGLGLPPAPDGPTRARYAALGAQVDAVFSDPVRARADRLLAAMDLPPLGARLMEARVAHCDAYLMPTVPGFEYEAPAMPDHVRFIGALPAPPSPGPLPDWWGDLRSGRRVVLVSQGTVANGDFGQLVEPTLRALADRDDLLVVATTGGRPIDAVAGPVPANARLATFLPFAPLLSKVDVLVTNGGYGTVSMALAAGVPLVVSGRSEDKAEVAARIAWSGVGIDLASEAPSPEAVRDAVSRVLDEPNFRDRAAALSRSFAEVDAAREVFSAFDGLVSRGAVRRGA